MTTPKIINAIQRYYVQQNRSKRIILLKNDLTRELSEDKVSLSKDGKRKELISRLTKEVVNNLILAKNQPEIVEEIKQELENEYGHKLLFKFNPKEKSLTVRREDKRPLSDEEQENLLKRIWDITYNKLNSVLSP
ncbi:hypothetical protein JCM13304A_14100 [Desulfothermus okinawensis JCM 13304]